MSLSDLSSTLNEERDYLLSVGAALQLVPHNATKWLRFERLLEVVLASESAATDLQSWHLTASLEGWNFSH